MVSFPYGTPLDEQLEIIEDLIGRGRYVSKSISYAGGLAIDHDKSVEPDGTRKPLTEKEKAEMRRREAAKDADIKNSDELDEYQGDQLIKDFAGDAI